MIGTIRRHQKWLWGVIIVATIISFVYFLSPSTRNNMFGGETASVNYGSIDGEPISTEEFTGAIQEARILYRLNAGEWPDLEAKRKELTQLAQERLFLDSTLKSYHITVTPEAAARFIRHLLGVRPGENVPAEKILETLNKLAQEGGVSMNDFDRFARHQAGQEYLIALLGMSGKLITPQEVAVFYLREHQPMDTELVTFPATNYYSQTVPTEKDITDFYTKREAEYRLPDRIQINYVAFEASNYLADAEKRAGTNLAGYVERVFQENAAGFKDEAGKPLSADAAKAKIKHEVLTGEARTMARVAANAFLNALGEGHDEQHPFARGDLAALAKTKSLTVKTTEPFDAKNLPKELDIHERDIHALFALREDEPEDKDHSMLYAPSPLVGDNIIYVVGLEKRIPSTIQPLSAVHDKVAADYRQGTALDLAKAAGSRFESALEAGLSQGKPFDTMCAAQFVHPQKLSPFSLVSRSIPEIPDKIETEEIMQVASRMQPGQVSPFLPTATGGFLLYYKGQLPVDKAAMQQELPGFLENMRDRLQIAAFNAWLNKEFPMHFAPPPGERVAGG